MPRMKVTFAYDGTNFSGYQIQSNVRTVQGELEAALKKLHKGHSVRVYASGRTDSGVHARGQVIHFDTNLTLLEENWLKALQTLLPDDIAVIKAEQVPPDFHARYDAQKKEYRYRILTRSKQDVFRRNFTYHVPTTLSVDAMKKALPYVEGTNDYTSFCSAKTNVDSKVRTIYRARLLEVDDELVFCFIGNGFLYHMVRILVGTLLEIGERKRQPEDLAAIMQARSREAAGKTAPAHGLFLWKVTYDPSITS